jgi:hypothetical protein
MDKVFALHIRPMLHGIAKGLDLRQNAMSCASMMTVALSHLTTHRDGLVFLGRVVAMMA